MKDVTGRPLSVDELKNALRVCKLQMVNIMKIPPELAVELLTIKLALEELINIKSTQPSEAECKEKE
jgi:hypothetical protein